MTTHLSSQVNHNVSKVRVKKRFVAGAKCPQCKATDSIVLFKEHGVETVECVECDYRDQQTEEQVAAKATGDVIGVFKP
ncbi:DNA-binding protein [Shewanella colwelliana]|uniref:DNA-binding protein n=1 Tax=Shewanella colwelliana TaxID=23 RepID=A0ABQ4NVL6_SHECO|nr:DNA-binding protein [Shewanella colwelliana]